MSNYSKLIIFVLAFVIIAAAIVFIDSSMDSINDSMPGISNNIVQGDTDYNEAVDLVNEKYYSSARDKANSAEQHYNQSLNELSKIKNNFTSDIDAVHKDYINKAYSEVELKLKAVERLKDSIDCFEVEENSTGTSYASEANDYIYEAQGYQKSRDLLIEENPNLFKENSIFN